ncbi:hypothetical protein C0Q70_03421 [Pomacea canaliculata]|uniref:Tropomodulin n=1 Tax=Pomacea canaliculata TaxID=400727 RepID=A0A2T7PSS7_POMCA|nr:hypothetical protein C0Q70_03421 [Pomacea canaliculata]
MTSLMTKPPVDAPDIDLENLDDLLAALSAEEIDELNGDFDPDNSLLPPSQRCRDQTDKDPTGPFSRQHLLDFLEKKAKTEKDWEQNKVYIKEQRGKKFVPKEPERTRVDDDDAVDTEWDEILSAASEEELVDLAGKSHICSLSLFELGAAKAEPLRPVPNEAPNMTSVEESIKKLRSNDPQLKSLNLNNIKNMSVEQMIEVCEALKENTTLVRFDMAGVAAPDKVGKKLAEALAVNKTLRSVNVESNFLSGEVIVELVKAINVNQILLELRVANQKPEILGNKVEMQISRLLQENKTLLRFGITFEFPDARIRTHERLKQNFDDLRKKRTGK